jgi:ribosomal protein L35
MRGHQHHTHLLSKKSAARKRRLVSQVEVDKVDRKRVRSMLGI